RGQAGGAGARLRRPAHARAAAAVEVEPVADDQAAAARRLDVAPVPVAVMFGDRDERGMRRTGPVETVAAVAEADLVRLGAVARLPAPDRKEPEEQALVRDAVEVVE